MPEKKVDDGASAASSPKKTGNDAVTQAEVQRLNLLVKQRDNEIGILLNYLNKKKEAGASTMGAADLAVVRAAGA